MQYRYTTRYRIFTQLALFCLLAFTASNASASFLMQNLRGEKVDLHAYLGQGQWTLVMLWTTDCIPCDESNARVIGLALDGPDKQNEIEKLIEKHQPNYVNLITFDDVFPRQFEEQTGKTFSVTPTYVFYKPDGELMGVHVGKVSREALESVVAR